MLADITEKRALVRETTLVAYQDSRKDEKLEKKLQTAQYFPGCQINIQTHKAQYWTH